MLSLSGTPRLSGGSAPKVASLHVPAAVPMQELRPQVSPLVTPRMGAVSGISSARASVQVPPVFALPITQVQEAPAVTWYTSAPSSRDARDGPGSASTSSPGRADMASLKAVRAEVEMGLAPLRLELKGLCESMASRMENLEGQMQHLAESLSHRMNLVELELREHLCASPQKAAAAAGLVPGPYTVLRGQSRGNGCSVEVPVLQQHPSAARLATASACSGCMRSPVRSNSASLEAPASLPALLPSAKDGGVSPSRLQELHGDAEEPRELASSRVPSTCALDCLGSYPGPGIIVQRLASGSAETCPTPGTGTPLLPRGRGGSSAGASITLRATVPTSRAASAAASARRRAPRSAEVGRGGKRVITAAGRGAVAPLRA